MGGETANQSTVIEATLKKWFRRQADVIKEKKEEGQKKEKAMAQAWRLAAASSYGAVRARGAGSRGW